MPNNDEQAERELESRVSARTEELSGLAAHLLLTTEKERADLAKKLHDELGGLITAAKMDMQWLSAHIGSSLDAPATEKFNSVVQMLNQAMILKRRVVENLRPSLLDHFGLGVALSSYFDEHCKEAKLDCVASLPEESLALTPAAQLAVFRVAQEVLGGILGRQGVRHVEVVIEPGVDEEAAGYVMTIGDDGAPMDVNLARVMPAMRQRVALIGGRIVAEAREGAGNQVRVYVPRSS